MPLWFHHNADVGNNYRKGGKKKKKSIFVAA